MHIVLALSLVSFVFAAPSVRCPSKCPPSLKCVKGKCEPNRECQLIEYIVGHLKSGCVREIVTDENNCPIYKESCSKENLSLRKMRTKECGKIYCKPGQECNKEKVECQPRTDCAISFPPYPPGPKGCYDRPGPLDEYDCPTPSKRICNGKEVNPFTNE